MQTKQLLSQLIGYDSQCVKSNKDIALFIASLFPPENVTIDRFKSKNSLDLYNVTIKIQGLNKNLPPLIFSGHTDTVPVSGSWLTDPFDAVEKNKEIFGLGAVDMKGGLTALIQTARQLIITKPERDVYFFFDADEEGGGEGGSRFLTQYTFNQADIIIAEPTDKKIIIGQKGVMELKITFSGRAQHVSLADQTYNEKNNAIYKAAAAIDCLKKLELELNAYEGNMFTSPTLTVCQITGGSGVNIVPAKTEMIISCRFLPSQQVEQIKASIIKAMKTIDKFVVVEDLLIGSANLVPAENPFVKLCLMIASSVGQSVQLDVFSGWTQAGIYRSWGSCLIWGPGQMNLAHTVKEQVAIKDIDLMSDIYLNLAKN
ncbi:TPA: hypothetical protein DF272_03035 [Candidatus Falkowbacteria bacterium]|nr:hypothetical protein [Candidatus Falkowbacteria bacterium]